MPPPKLVAPTMKNAAKIWPIPTCCRRDRASALPTARTGADLAKATLLVPLAPAALELVDDPRFGGTEPNPVADVALQRHKVLLDEVFGLAGNVLSPIELRLEGKLADQRPVVATGSPERDVRLRNQSLAEIKLAERQLELLDNAFVDEPDSVLV